VGKRSNLAEDRRRGGAGKEAPPPPKVERGRAESPAGDLDRLIHERQRLGIVSALAVNESLTCKKSFEGRVPRTEYSLTAPGRRALERYLDHMEAIIKATRNK
jgi:hypothetical protein